MKKCSKCRIEKPLDVFCVDNSRKDGRQNYCKECKQAWERSNSARRAEEKRVYKERYPERVKARMTVFNRIASGKLIPQPCESCGLGVTETSIQAHHEDYTKPLEVNWLCMDCHTHKRKVLSIKEQA